MASFYERDSVACGLSKTAAFFQTVTDASGRSDHHRAVLELGPQLEGVDIDDASITVIIKAPQLI